MLDCFSQPSNAYNGWQTALIANAETTILVLLTIRISVEQDEVDLKKYHDFYVTHKLSRLQEEIK